MWDQYKTKAKKEEHFRIHPILSWTEMDIWKYIEREKIPMVDLYLAKDGKRYRSIGCETCCNPVDSNADTVEKIIEELSTSKFLRGVEERRTKNRIYDAEVKSIRLYVKGENNYAKKAIINSYCGTC